MFDVLKAEVTLRDAENLSTTAEVFGVRKRRDLRDLPEGSLRPYVGGNPGYYRERATKVFRKAIKADPQLKNMYLRAWSLGSGIVRTTSKPYLLAGPSLEVARQIPEAVEAIHDRIDEMDLRVPIEGKWYERACAISAFALDVVSGDGLSLPIFPREEGQGKLLKGLPEDFDLNTVSFWTSLRSRLQPEVRV